MKALITGSGGLIGSVCPRLLASEGWEVVGVDNDMRGQFFGPQGTTTPVVDELVRSARGYRHIAADSRARQGLSLVECTGWCGARGLPPIWAEPRH
jgi:CDP-paratose 2-epimerase